MPHGTNRGRRAFLIGAAAMAVAPRAPWAAGKGGKTAARPPQRPALIGELRHHMTTYEDTLLDLARDNNLGFVEIVAANPGVDPWVPGEGTKIVLPTAHLLPAGPREGLLLNLVDQRLYYFPPDGGPTQSHPIGTGQEAWDTPLGSTKIVRKRRDPTWTVPKSIREEDPSLPAVVKPGPDNPLGRYALNLGWPSYLIHGTNRPWGVGRRVSHGCIRLYPEGIEKLFAQIPVGTPVTVVSQELKLGWHGNELYMEVHPNPDHQLELEATGEFTPAPVPELAYRVAEAAGAARARVDWQRVHRIAADRSGVPVPILVYKTSQGLPGGA